MAGALEVRDAVEADLEAIVAIYNSTIPSRMATADLEPVSVEERRPWFREHSADSRPLWVIEVDGVVAAWLSIQSFYGRPAWNPTAEVSVYVSEANRRRGLSRRLLQEAIRRSPGLALTTLLALVYGHNDPSIRLFEGMGFERWGLLPRVNNLDGVERDVLLLGLRVPDLC